MILNRERNATTAVSKPAVAYAIGLAALLVAACSLLSPVVAVPLGLAGFASLVRRARTDPTLRG